MTTAQQGPAPAQGGDPAAGALAQAEARHRRGVAANAAGHPHTAAEHFRAGLRLLGPAPGAPPAAAQAARLLISLAHAEAEQGRVERGLEVLDRADPLVAPKDRSLLLSQRALLQWRAGRYRLALPLFDQAVELLSARAEPVELIRALLNRGGLLMAVMRLDAARADLARCERLAREQGAELQVAKAVNGLGYCALLAGNIPVALDLLSRAEAGYREHGPGNVPIAQVDRARALMAAGLAHDAVPELESAVAAFHAQRLAQDRADAELTLAQALAGSGRPARAAQQARQAERHFRARGNDTGATLARLTAARADFERWFAPGPGAETDGDRADGADGADGAQADASAGPYDRSAGAPTQPAPSPARLAAQAERLAGRLEQLGLPRDAALARLLSARALLRADAPPEQIGRRIREAAPRGLGLPLETRLTVRLALAELAAARGERAGAYTQLRRGLALLAAHRAALGSVDLQTGVAALGRELTATGLRLALTGGSPRVIFAWSERSRAQALRIRPVRPPDDPHAAAAAARLRQLDHDLRAGEAQGRVDPDVRRQHAALRRKLREDAWTAAKS